jgi:hypothetical protein
MRAKEFLLIESEFDDLDLEIVSNNLLSILLKLIEDLLILSDKKIVLNMF